MGALTGGNSGNSNSSGGIGGLIGGLFGGSSEQKKDEEKKGGWFSWWRQKRVVKKAHNANHKWSFGGLLDSAFDSIKESQEKDEEEKKKEEEEAEKLRQEEEKTENNDLQNAQEEEQKAEEEEAKSFNDDEDTTNANLGDQIGNFFSNLGNKNDTQQTSGNTSNGQTEGNSNSIMTMFGGLMGDKNKESGKTQESQSIMNMFGGLFADDNKDQTKSKDDSSFIGSFFSGNDEQKKENTGSKIGSFFGGLFGQSKSVYKNFLSTSAIQIQALPFKHEAKMKDIKSMVGVNFDQLKTKLLRGNTELALFSHLHGNKTLTKKFIKELYHYMGGKIDKSVASEMGDFLKMLKKVAAVTQDTSLNEFLGTFDMMCQNLYTKN